jgi:transcriptional regulator NrdR family protein
MATIYVEANQESKEILGLVRAAVDNEITKLELALKLALKRLVPFEQKYGVTSDYFIAEMVAEDLEGQDEEYVRWAGEYKLTERLQKKLKLLREISYDS